MYLWNMPSCTVVSMIMFNFNHDYNFHLSFHFDLVPPAKQIKSLYLVKFWQKLKFANKDYGQTKNNAYSLIFDLRDIKSLQRNSYARSDWLYVCMHKKNFLTVKYELW